MIMSFGKYQGYDLKDIPTNYLLWIDDNIPSTAPTKQMRMKAFIKAELKNRATPADKELRQDELKGC